MSPEIQKMLVWALQLIVVAGVTYLIKGQQQHGNELRDLKTTLIGIDGKNGIRGDVTELKGATEEQWKHIAKHDSEIAVLKAKAGTI